MKRLSLFICLMCFVIGIMQAQNDSILLVYFSRAGENYNMKDGNAIGSIERGNTAVLADIIVEETGAKVHEILPQNDYPYNYQQCVAQANQERDDDARPAIKYPLPFDLSHYQYIFIGSPVWCSQCPMIMRTFYETYATQLAGKTIIPFGTHEGSGISSLVRNIQSYLPSDITLLKEYGIYGHNVRNEGTPESVRTWIAGLNLPKQTTALESITGETANSQAYNTLGQKVTADYKGIVIQNGKKTMQQ